MTSRHTTIRMAPPINTEQQPEQSARPPIERVKTLAGNSQPAILRRQLASRSRDHYALYANERFVCYTSWMINCALRTAENSIYDMCRLESQYSLEKYEDCLAICTFKL